MLGSVTNMTIVGIHSCDECRKSALLIVCHMPESILCQISRPCRPTTECQIVQSVPNTTISRQFVSKLLANLQLFLVLPFRIDDRPNKDAKLCKVAPLSCLPIRSITQRIFEHVPPCHRTTLVYVREVSATLVICQLLQQKIRDSNISSYCSHAFTLSASHVYVIKK